MNFKKIVDLSIPVSMETPIYPSDPKPNINPAATIEKDGFNVTMLHLCTHTGTHIDAPWHRQTNGATVDQLALTKLMARGRVIDVTGKQPGERITLDEVADQISTIQPGTIVLFHTGWDKHIGTATYYKNPYLEVDIIHTLIDKNVTTFCIDSLNMDPSDGSSFPVHDAITSVNGIIGENLCNLNKITFPNPFIIALPIKLQGLDGSLVRAVALEIE